MNDPVLPKRGTLKSELLFLLLSGYSFKNRDMWLPLDTGCSAPRISELRADGWEIHNRQDVSSKRDKTYYMTSLFISEQLTRPDVQEFMVLMSRLTKKVG